MVVARHIPHEDTHLAVIDFAAVAAPLALDSHRMRPPLWEAAGIKGDDAIGFPQLLDHLSYQHRDQRAMIPGRSADELLQDQALDIDRGGDRLGILAVQVGQVSGLPVCKAADLVEATQDSGAFVQMSATLKRAAVQISKICNDLRWLSSGPRCGLYEMTLPPMQPGSSIMPGKVNPVIPEVVNQICFQIIGYDAVVSMAAEASELELNMAEPVIAFDLLHGLMLLKNACIILTSRCIVGIHANRERCRQYVENSIGLVTALNPVLGYERSAAIAKEALATNGSVYDLVLQKGWLTQEAPDDILKPENMTAPRQLP
jgi:aspartate ammonia-lyase